MRGGGGEGYKFCVLKILPNCSQKPKRSLLLGTQKAQRKDVSGPHISLLSQHLRSLDVTIHPFNKLGRGLLGAGPVLRVGDIREMWLLCLRISSGFLNSQGER